MNRREFFGLAAGLFAAAAVDPERLLWVPGKRKIFIPPERPIAITLIADPIADPWSRAAWSEMVVITQILPREWFVELYPQRMPWARS